MPDERPARRVDVDGFFLDTTLVSNRDFAEFAAETGYVTTAEQTPDVSTLMAQLPPGTPPPNPDLLRPGSLVFEPPPHHVPFHDMSAWWTWVPGASWGHPEGPGSDLRGRADHPVVQVSWNDAVAFCRWAGKRLPSEAEWEYAARGGLEGRRYVWGDEPNPEGRHLANVFQGTFPQLNTIEDGFPRTSPVDAFPANGYGLHDMAGNTWQWCSDRYRSGPRRETGPSCHDTSDSLADPQLERVIKGGSFLCHASYCESYRPSARRGSTPDTSTAHIGFRCARSVD
jgi:formylglycine-generating enzyme required for sulfatase activity